MISRYVDRLIRAIVKLEDGEALGCPVTQQALLSFGNPKAKTSALLVAEVRPLKQSALIPYANAWLKR
jgi:hypothetical protein